MRWLNCREIDPPLDGEWGAVGEDGTFSGELILLATLVLIYNLSFSLSQLIGCIEEEIPVQDMPQMLIDKGLMGQAAYGKVDWVMSGVMVTR